MLHNVTRVSSSIPIVCRECFEALVNAKGKFRKWFHQTDDTMKPEFTGKKAKPRAKQ